MLAEDWLPAIVACSSIVNGGSWCLAGAAYGIAVTSGIAIASTGIIAVVIVLATFSLVA